MADYNISTHWDHLVKASFNDLRIAEQSLDGAEKEYAAMRAGIAAAFFVYHFHEVVNARDALGSGRDLLKVRRTIEAATRTASGESRAEDHKLLGHVVDAVKHGFLDSKKLLVEADGVVLTISAGGVMVFDEEGRDGAPMVIVVTVGGDRSLTSICHNILYGWSDLLGLPVGDKPQAILANIWSGSLPE